MPAINCNFIDNAVWSQAEAGSFVPNENIDVWRIPVTENLPLLPYFMTKISGDELDKAVSYHQENDVNRFIITRCMLRFLLGKYLDQAPGAIQLETGRHKKPTMQNGALGNWHYNISHSGDWILIAIARSGVGIDVEKMEDHFDYTGMLKRCFSLPEVRHLQSGFQARDSFYLLWTRKEALLKATGIGLVEHLECIPCMDGAHMVDPGMIGSEEDWTVSSFVLDRRYVCSIACHPHFKGLRLWDANVGVLD